MAFPRTCAAVLAAGESRRMGFPKLTAPFAGSSLLERAVGAALASEAALVAVVTGAYHEAMAPVLRHIASAAGKPLDIVRNGQWAEGQGTSVAVAARYGRECGCDSLVVMVADQPFVSADVIDALIAARCESRAPVAMCSDGTRQGNPAIFDESLFESLGNLRDDEGARAVVRTLSQEVVATVAVDARVLRDVDTPEEFARWECEAVACG